MTEREKRTKNVRVRLTPFEREHAEMEAQREGMTLSTFMRRLLSLRIGSGFIRKGGKPPKGEGGPPPAPESI